MGVGGRAVITLSIRLQDVLRQPTGLMFDRIIRKLSQPVITGAHLWHRRLLFTLSLTYSHTEPSGDWYLAGCVD